MFIHLFQFFNCNNSHMDWDKTICLDSIVLNVTWVYNFEIHRRGYHINIQRNLVLDLTQMGSCSSSTPQNLAKSASTNQLTLYELLGLRSIPLYFVHLNHCNIFFTRIAWLFLRLCTHLAHWFIAYIIPSLEFIDR